MDGTGVPNIFFQSGQRDGVASLLGGANVRIGLYSSLTAPLDRDLVLGDVVPVIFSGYAPTATSGFVASGTNGDGDPICTCSPAAIVGSTPLAVPDTIVGIYLFDSVALVLVAVIPLDVPIIVLNDGQLAAVALTFDGQDSNFFVEVSSQ